MSSRVVVLATIVLVIGVSFIPAAQNELGELKGLFARAADERPAEFIDALFRVLKSNLSSQKVTTIRNELAVEIDIDLSLINHPQASELSKLKQRMKRMGISNVPVLMDYMKSNAEWSKKNQLED